MTDLQKRIETLSDKKRKLLDLMVAKGMKRISAYPLSFAQQRLWLLDQLEPGGLSYNVPFGVRLVGDLDKEALRRSMAEIIRRHEVLRTSFPARDGRPAQKVAADLRLPMEELDLRHLPAEQAETEAVALAKAAACVPFDLSTGPLLRLKLVQLRDSEHVLLMIMHHIVSDAWSSRILLQEFTQLYEAYRAGKPSPLPELKVQYGEFAVWQRGWLKGEVLDHHLSYWRKQLSGATTLELPADKPRPEKWSSKAESVRFEAPLELTEKIKDLSRKEGVTLFMVVLAALHVTLGKYAGQTDVAVGTAVANRNRVETEGLIGFLVNTLVLRGDLGGNPTVSGLLARTRQMVLDAYEHQDLPFEKLVDELHPERDPSRSPFFQVMLVLQNIEQQELRMPGLKLAEFSWPTETALFDLQFTLSESAKGIAGRLTYAVEMYESETVQRMAVHLVEVLRQMASAPQQRISEISVLTDQERRQVLVEWNQPQPESPVRCLHQWFAEQAAAEPQRTAVIFENQQLTYGELDRRANQLAHHLRTIGVGPDVLVGLCSERGLEMITALLAILKAGGAYVPLDPSYPVARLNYMLDDTHAPVLLMQKSLNLVLPSYNGKVVELGQDGEQFACEPVTAPPGNVCPESVAYVIYTSGSTGQPKGVMVTHANVARLMRQTQRWFHFDHDDCWTLFHSYAFDFSVWEIWGALLYGGRLVVVPYSVSRSPEDMLKLLAANGVTVLNQTPSAFEQLMWAEEAAAQKFDLALRVVIFGGEALEFSKLRPWVKRHPLQPQLVNMYGITETTVHVTYYPLQAADVLDELANSPIGVSIGDLQVYVLDDSMQPVPPGVKGEMYVGGAGLARGYLHRPELTAARFVPNPFIQKPGERLYRSGDQARWRSDGTLDYFGRIDSQVKIHGFRIELGEIEAALLDFPGVQQAVVAAREDKGEKKLVGYIVPEPGDAPSTKQLREHVKSKLPVHMVPAAFVVLEQMPLTTNGKLDRAALPAPEVTVACDAESEPRTHTEKILCGIWGELLKLDHVGIHDNFFELGGDSILAIQVTARARKAGVQLRPAQMFALQTVAELAEAIGQAGPALLDEQAASEGKVPLTPVQAAFFQWGLGKPEHFNQAVLLEINPHVESPSLEQAVLSLLQHHDALRMRFKEVESEWVQYCEPALLGAVYERQDFSGLAPVEQRRALEEHAAHIEASLDLQKGRLVRAVEYDLRPAHGRLLLLVVHHLIIDGVSWRILLEDLETAYEQARQKLSIQLGPRTASYKQWAESLEQYSTTDALKQEVDYWTRTRRLQRLAPLPRDFDASDLEDFPSTQKTVLVNLTADETLKLLQEVPAAYGTQINDVLLTALGRVCSEWNGGAPVLVDMEGHGREEVFPGVDVSRTVGWFTTIYPVVLQVPAGNGWRPGHSLKQTKEQLRRVPNRGFGYGVLRYVSQDKAIQHILKESPRAEIAFNYLGQFDQVFESSRLFKPAVEDAGRMVAERNRRRYAIEVNAMVVQGKLQASWSYSARLHRVETIQKIAAQFVACLRELIEHCIEAEAGQKTPSDFPLANLSEKELERIASALQ